MSINIFRSVLAAVILTVCGNAYAITPNSVDSLYAELQKAKTPADSVVVLHNLYDCFYFDDRKPILYKIFETAERAGDYRSMLETVFVLCALYQHEPAMEQELLEMADRVPESELQKATKLYIRLRYEASSLNSMSEKQRQQLLHQTLKEYRESSRFDKYDRIAYLFFICNNLRSTGDSDMLKYYLFQLKELVEELPEEELPVRSIYYSLALDVFLDNGLYKDALVANNRMLDLVGEFDKLHAAQGRVFRNYDGSLYQCYHNMLICADELTDEEIDHYYDLLLHITATNPRIHQNTAMQHRSRIEYLMAKKRYDEALPLIKLQLQANNTPTDYKHFAQALVKAARATGDTDGLLHGSKIINNIYHERLATKSDVSLSELQTIYDVEDLKGQNKNLVIENQNIEIKNHQQFVIASAIALVVVICLLAWMVSLYIHSRSLARGLSATNKRLTEERNTLKDTETKLIEARDKAKDADRVKNDFVENMSTEIRVPLDAIVEYAHLIIDFAEEDERPYISEYADVVSVNTDLLIRLVNDVLDLPQLENGELSIHRSPSSVNAICNFALKLVAKHVAPDVEIIFTNRNQQDTRILTDPQRIEQVLIQMLTNAAKFTESGSITFGYEISPQRDKISFTVTDTGIGVPRGMEEKIFERFVKADPTTQGNGLGLYISRILADMLGGTLTLDMDYRSGARFILTIPIA